MLGASTPGPAIISVTVKGQTSTYNPPMFTNPTYNYDSQPVVNPTTLPNGTVGTPYSVTFSSPGGTAPFTFAVTAGTLPPGLTLTPSTGVLTGIPTFAGPFTFTITATDADNNTGTQTYTVLMLPSITTPGPISGTSLTSPAAITLAGNFGTNAVAANTTVTFTTTKGTSTVTSASSGTNGSLGTVTSTSITVTPPAYTVVGLTGDGPAIVSVTVNGETSTATNPTYNYVDISTVTAVSSPSATGYYNATTKRAIVITVTFSSAVQVTGTPKLALNSSSGALASYFSGTGTTTLTFHYVVEAGDNSARLDYTNTTALSLNGGTIMDSPLDQNNAILTLPANGNAATDPLFGKNIVVDTTPPTVTIGNPSTMITAAGPVNFTVTYGSAYFSTSTLTAANIALNTTGTANGTVAVTGTGTSTCTVTIGNITGNGTLSISIAASTASDLAGNLAPAAGPSSTFTVDNTIPTVTAVSSTTPAGTYPAGTVIPITVTFSSPVIVTATPTLTLNTTPTNAVVNYTSGSGTNALLFNYTVAPGQTSSILDYTNTTALALNGGTIMDAAAVNNATLTLPATRSDGLFNQDIVIATSPTVTTNTANLLINTATTLTIAGTNFSTTAANDTVAFSGPGSASIAGSVTAATTTSLTYTITTDPSSLGELDAVVTVSGVGSSSSPIQVATSVALPTVTANRANWLNNSTTLTISGTNFSPIAGNNIVAFSGPGSTGIVGSVTTATTTLLTYTITTDPSSLGELDAVVTVSGVGNSGLPIQVATVISSGPTITAVSPTTPPGTYAAGATIPITLTFSEPVTVTGTPTLALNTTPGAVASYAGVTGTLTTLATFTGTANGANPDASLIEDSSGNFFGTTTYGGASADGTVFEIAGGTHTLTTLATFTGTQTALTPMRPDRGQQRQPLRHDLIWRQRRTTARCSRWQRAPTPLPPWLPLPATVLPETVTTLKPAWSRTAAATSSARPISGGASNDGTVFEVAAGTHTLTTLVTFNGH